MIVFPEKILEVHEQVLTEVCSEKMAALACTQERIESGVISDNLPIGMEASVIIFYGDRHTQQICACHKGFNLFRVSLN